MNTGKQKQAKPIASTTTDWRTILRNRMKELDIRHEMLAEEIGMSRPMITHYLSGRRQPSIEDFLRIAEAVDMDPSLLVGNTVTAIAGNSKDSPRVSTKKSKEMMREANGVPILPWSAIHNKKVEAHKMVDAHTELAPYFSEKNNDLYALRVQGDAMNAALGQIKSFNEGDILIIDPEKKPADGNYVICWISGTKEATFKQYVIDSGVPYLKPLNPQYPLVRFAKGSHMCGVVIAQLRIFDYSLANK